MAIDLVKLRQDIQDFINVTPKEEIYKMMGLHKKEPDKSTDFLISKEMAESLKPLGFNLPCIFGDIYGDGEIYGMEQGDMGYSDFKLRKHIPIKNSDYKYSGFAVPSYEQVFKWLRDKGYETMIHYKYSQDLCCAIGYEYEIIYKNQLLERDGLYEEYEEAREAALLSIIKHLSSI